MNIGSGIGIGVDNFMRVDATNGRNTPELFRGQNKNAFDEMFKWNGTERSCMTVKTTTKRWILCRFTSRTHTHETTAQALTIGHQWARVPNSDSNEWASLQHGKPHTHIHTPMHTSASTVTMLLYESKPSSFFRNIVCAVANVLDFQLYDLERASCSLFTQSMCISPLKRKKKPELVYELEPHLYVCWSGSLIPG